MATSSRMSKNKAIGSIGGFSESRKSFHWMSAYDTQDLTDFKREFLDEDWANSSLGPISQWSAQLSQLVYLVISDPNPAAVCWGTETTTTIRNEAYTKIINSKVTQRLDEESKFVGGWDKIEPVLRKQRDNGIATIMPQQPLLLQQEEVPQEVYFTWKFIPITDPEGSIVGCHVTGLDVTHEVVATRRLKTISLLGRAIATAETTKNFLEMALNSLEHAFEDVPFALIYTVNHSTSGPRALPSAERPRYSTQPLTCTLEGSVGIPIDDQSIIPATFHLSQDEYWLATAFKKALDSGTVVHLSAQDGNMPANLVQDSRFYNRRPSRMVICPLYSNRLGVVRAFFVLAVNSWGPYDDECLNFVRTLTDQVAISYLASGGFGEDAQKLRQPKEGVPDTASQKQLARFTARAQVALGILDAKGSVVFANPLWADLTQLTPGEDQPAWAKAIIEEDLGETLTVFARMVAEASPVDFHLRFNKRWKAPVVDNNGNPIFTDTHIICSLFPDLDENGKVTTIMSCLTDISELKWTESQLRQRTADVEHREAMWRNFTDRAPIGLGLLRPDGSLEFGNDTWWTMTQSPRDEKSGLAWVQKSIVAEDIPQVEKMFLDSLNHDAPRTLEFRLNKTADLSKSAVLEHDTAVNVTILSTVHTTFESDGSVQHLVVWLTDITAQKLAENNLRKRMNQAISMKLQQEKFIDMTSHELRNPLSAMLHCADEIIGALNAYLITPTNDLVVDSIEAANTIIYCAIHQKRIVDDILTLSRLDSDLLVISPQPVMLSKLIRQAVKMFEAELKKAKISLHLREDDLLRNGDFWTLFDPGRVLQIFVNLMTNAIKFTRGKENGQIKVAIGASYLNPTEMEQETKYIPKRENMQPQISGREWGNGEPVFLKISVADTGRGMTQEEMDLLFNAFQQASPKTYAQYGGSGLGLFISRQLVEMQGGEIGVASTAGKGSTFSCYIKARKTEAPVITLSTDDKATTFVDAEALMRASGGDLSAQGSRIDAPDNLTVQTQFFDLSPHGNLQGNENKLHILVVEDNLINQNIVTKQLRRHGCIVHVANHGVEALAFVRRTEYYVGIPYGLKLSVILMDMEMPFMNGLTCVKKIREAQTQGLIKGYIPIIAITANARSDQIAEAMEAGTDYVMTKPYRIPDIISQVESLLARLKGSNGVT